MREIGGYFDLELPRGNGHFHKISKTVNNGRNALKLILNDLTVEKVFVPRYICEAVLDVLEAENYKYELYDLDKNFYPKINFEDVSQNDAFIYVNYLGICSSNVARIIKLQKSNLFYFIIDNSQAFFHQINYTTRTYAFNSARKFFGVPDGAYIIGETKNMFNEWDSSRSCLHLLGRIESGASDYYDEFQKNELVHASLDLADMSKITKKILCSVDYLEVKNRRLDNFNYLHQQLKNQNLLDINLTYNDVPIAYPLLVSLGHELKSFLIERKIFVPTYWPNKKIRLNEHSFEKFLTENLVAIPIDQRYGIEDMDYILKFIKKWCD